MTLTANEAVQVLEAMRICLNPLWVKYGDDWRRDEALRMAIEKIKESEKNVE